MNIGYVLENEEKNLEKASKSLKELKKTAKDAGTETANAFVETIDCIETLTVALDKLSGHVVNISESLAQVATVDFGAMLQELSAIFETATQVTKELGSVGWEEYVALGMQAFSAGFDVFAYLKPQKRGSEPITEMLSSTVLGKVGPGGLGPEPEAGTKIMSEGFNKLREALDGVNLSQIAATASQWIQNAAVTAWNGICGAVSPGRLKTVLYRSTRNFAGRDNFCRVWPVITRIRRLNGGPYPGGA